ncbi:MAG: ABC-three component system middle component 2 [Acidobacteriaceae bacterium]
MTQPRALTFNSPLETGVRALAVLLAAHPRSFDLQRLMAFDHLVVHTGDIGGPESLHPKLPMRSAEILVRRRLVESGLMLMASRGLVERIVDGRGIHYRAAELAAPVMSSMTTPYFAALQRCAGWAVETFASLDDTKFRVAMARFFDQWVEEFQAVQRSLAVDL